MKKNIKRQNGITLIALVVTIVVLLILAGVTINLLFSDTGLFGKAQEAENAWRNAENSDRDAIGDLANQVNDLLNGIGAGGTTPGGDDVTTLPTDGSYNEEKGVNTPKLGANMTLVKFDTETQDWIPDETNSAYSYVDTATEGANTSEWANAVVTKDGIESYFVWIPRYAYKITYYTNSDKTTTSSTPTQYGTIDIKFIKDTGNIATDGETVCKYADENPTANDYIIHPAFTTDENYGGGWENELPGIWIGKYETARSDTEGATQGSAPTLKVQTGVTSYRNDTIGNMYDNALAYDTNLKSHMLKNSEWGAVAYLTESKYGRNGTEVTINNNGTTYYTGGGAENAYIDNTAQSSTGNVYGIYDLRGGAAEYVASYYSGSSSLSNGSFANGTSDEYSTAYDGTSAYKYGDATYETSGWHSDFAAFVVSTYPFFSRGGSYYAYASDSGVFYYLSSDGTANDGLSFRLALVV